MELEFKKIKAITKIAKQSKVVNFSVQKNENYFANSILTHNCYMKRHKPKGLDIAKNTMSILTEINSHCMFATVNKPNQTHNEYITYDISCNEDFALHAKYHEWKSIFDFFKNHPNAMGSFATKYVNMNLLSFNPNGKIRIRYSLMPQNISDILEPNTSKIIGRIKAIDTFIDAGYDVHINFSPVIVYKDWLKDYEMLFQLVNENVAHKEIVKCEVIFLTHNKNKHAYNLDNNLKGEELLWTPNIQESKLSQYGGDNIRYKHTLKDNYIKEWSKLHNSIIPWNKIRYCFTFIVMLCQIL
jgi:spore photoproduct lyase